MLKKPTLSKKFFLRLLNIVTCDVMFSFNNDMYAQNYGVAMESPLGHSLTNIFMGLLESKIMYKVESKIYYFRYVDNFFVIPENETDLDSNIF